MSNKDIAKKIREELKVEGYTSRKVSVVSDWSRITITVKDKSVDMKIVNSIRNKHVHIRYDEITGEVLSGGNTYVFVSVDY